MKTKLTSTQGISDLLCYDYIDSTNTEAKRLLVENNLSPPALLVADHQSGGRGRLGREFLSIGQNSIYLSLVILNDFKDDNILLATIASGVAVVRTINKFCNLIPKIKWVNDVFVDDKKVCGILAEGYCDDKTSSISHIIIGIGINIDLNPGEEVIDARQKIGAIALGGHKRDAFIEGLVNELFDCLQSLKSGRDTVALKKELLDEYRAYSLVIGKEIAFTRGDKTYEARAIDIGEDGSLIVDIGGREERLNYGEVSIRNW